jgi:hypothetical protein
MRQGDSDRDIDRSKTMGRKKLAAVREIAIERGWLSPDNALPDDAQLAAWSLLPESFWGGCFVGVVTWDDLSVLQLCGTARRFMTRWAVTGGVVLVLDPRSCVDISFVLEPAMRCHG